MHRLRKRCRRERYNAEFAVPLFGPEVADLAKRLKDVADALGDIHDMDVYLERLEKFSLPSPKSLRKRLKKLRGKYLKAFAGVWDRLFCPDFAAQLLSSLDCS